MQHSAEIYRYLIPDKKLTILIDLFVYVLYYCFKLGIWLYFNNLAVVVEF